MTTFKGNDISHTEPPHKHIVALTIHIYDAGNIKLFGLHRDSSIGDAMTITPRAHYSEEEECFLLSDTCPIKLAAFLEIALGAQLSLNMRDMREINARPHEHFTLQMAQ